MISLTPSQTYLFVIDTEQYAGNFERMMCAYMTGSIGECEVGDKEKEIFEKEMGIKPDADGVLHDPFEFVIGRADDHGCSRPVTIYPTIGWFNNGLGGEFRDGEEVKALKHYHERCHEEAERLYVSSKDDWLARAKSVNLRKYPSYLSVAIFMERAPTDEEWKILEERAVKFTSYWEETEHKKIKITGFRLILEEHKYTCMLYKPVTVKTMGKM